MKRLSILALCLLVAVSWSFADSSDEDIILTAKGEVFRGTINDKLTAGGTISITPDAGQALAVYWSEIVAIKRLPRGIPDSVLIGSFDHKNAADQSGRPVEVILPPNKGAKFDFKGYVDDEDIVFLVDGSVLRGIVLNQKRDGTVSLWTSGAWKEIGGPAVLASVRSKRGIPDSTLVNTYVKVPEEWRAGENRILSIHAGYVFPVGDFAQPTDKGGSNTKGAYAIGLDAGLRIMPGYRWLTSVAYSRHSRDLPPAVVDADAQGGGATSCSVFQIYTGIEIRSSGPSILHAHAAAQVGLVALNADSYELTIPQTYTHLPGKAVISGFSTSTLGFALTGGVLIGRFSVDLRWASFKPEYSTKTDLLYIYNYSQSLEKTVDERSSLFTLTVGFSIY